MCIWCGEERTAKAIRFERDGGKVPAHCCLGCGFAVLNTASFIDNDEDMQQHRVRLDDGSGREGIYLGDCGYAAGLWCCECGDTFVEEFHVIQLINDGAGVLFHAHCWKDVASATNEQLTSMAEDNIEVFLPELL